MLYFTNFVVVTSITSNYVKLKLEKDLSSHFQPHRWLGLEKSEIFKPWCVQVLLDRWTDEGNWKTRGIRNYNFIHKLHLWHLTKYLVTFIEEIFNGKLHFLHSGVTPFFTSIVVYSKHIKLNMQLPVPKWQL